MASSRTSSSPNSNLNNFIIATALGISSALATSFFLKRSHANVTRKRIQQEQEDKEQQQKKAELLIEKVIEFYATENKEQLEKLADEVPNCFEAQYYQFKRAIFYNNTKGALQLNYHLVRRMKATATTTERLRLVEYVIASFFDNDQATVKQLVSEAVEAGHHELVLLHVEDLMRFNMRGGNTVMQKAEQLCNKVTMASTISPYHLAHAHFLKTLMLELKAQMGLLGQTMTNAQFIEQQLKLLKLALELYPKHVASLSTRAACYQQQRLNQNALADLEKITKLNPTSSHWLNYCALTLQQSRDSTSVLNAGKKLVEKMPKENLGYAALLMAYVAKLDFDKIASTIDEALRNVTDDEAKMTFVSQKLMLSLFLGKIDEVKAEIQNLLFDKPSKIGVNSVKQVSKFLGNVEIAKVKVPELKTFLEQKQENFSYVPDREELKSIDLPVTATDEITALFADAVGYLLLCPEEYPEMGTGLMQTLDALKKSGRALPYGFLRTNAFMVSILIKYGLSEGLINAISDACQGNPADPKAAAIQFIEENT